MEKSQFIEKIADFIVQNRIFEPKESIIVAISGGADSVALLLAMMQLGYDCRAAHCNFHLRGEESNRDENFVRDLCDRLGVKLDVADFDVASYVEAHKVSVEMACRELRYEWFEQLRKEHGCQCIAVAHHSDDNEETLLLNILRGTGIAGLAAIKPVNGKIARPLLCVGRNNIEQFLGECGESYVVDSTNAECDYKRNKLRNVVLPTLRQCFPDADAGLLRTIDNAQSCNVLYSEAVRRMMEEISHKTDSCDLVISIEKLLKVKSAVTLLFEMLRPFGFNHTQIVQFVNGGLQSGRRIDSNSHCAAVNRDVIEVFPIKNDGDEEWPIDLSQTEITEPVRLTVEHDALEGFSPSMCNGTTVVCFDKAITEGHSAVLRRWRKGDRFRPFGLKGTKLVSDLMADKKIGEEAKRNVWLLTIDGKIVWVLGLRSSGLYSVALGSRDYVRISLK